MNLNSFVPRNREHILHIADRLVRSLIEQILPLDYFFFAERTYAVLKTGNINGHMCPRRPAIGTKFLRVLLTCPDGVFRVPFPLPAGLFVPYGARRVLAVSRQKFTQKLFQSIHAVVSGTSHLTAPLHYEK